MTIEQDTIVAAAWEKAAADYEALLASMPNSDTSDEDLDAWCADLDAAVKALLAMRAPSPAAIASKARAVLFASSRYGDEKADDPRTIAMLLDCDPLEALAASVFQDGLALAGERPDLTAVQPNGFDARAWLADVEARTGARLVFHRCPGAMFAFRGGWAKRAEAEMATLMSREREWVCDLIPVN
jgi:hypothetical protein